MAEQEVETVFRCLRWPGTKGEPVCPGCGCRICYTERAVVTVDPDRGVTEPHNTELAGEGEPILPETQSITNP